MLIVFFNSENFAAHIDRDFLRQVAAGDGRGHVGDVAHLAGEIAGHEVDAVGEVFPRAGHVFHVGLPAELSFGADFAGHAGHFRGERAELIDHRVDRVLQFENFALHVDRDLLRQIAAGDGFGHLGDVAHLGREIAGHEIHAVGEVFPGAGHVAHFRLPAELSFGADFAGHAGHFRGERAELIDHRVDRVLQFENFAAHIDFDLLRKIAVGDGRGHFGDIAHLGREIAGHEVDAVGQVFPSAGDAFHVGLPAELSFGADFAGHAGHFRGERTELIDHRVDRVLQLEDFALHIDRDLLRQVAGGDGGGHGGDVAHLGREIAGHEIDAVGQVFPSAGDAFHVGLAAELSFGADFARHAGHFRGERAELIDHRVDRVLQFEDFALHIDRDLLRQVAVGDGGRHGGDVAHLGREIAGHEIDAVGQVFPRAGAPSTRACPPSFPSVPTSRATRVTSEANERS